MPLLQKKCIANISLIFFLSTCLHAHSVSPTAIASSSTVVLFNQPALLIVAIFCACIGVISLGYKRRRVFRRLSNLERQRYDLYSYLFELSDRLQANKTSSNHMLRLLGHDLRSPIASLQTYADILIEKKGDVCPEEIQEIAHSIKSTCILQLELLHNLLNLNSDTSTAPALPDVLQLDDIIERAWDNVAHLASCKQIERVSATQEVPYVYINPDALQTILRNLFTNAIKFSHPGGRITIRTENAGGGNARLLISDSGVGISAERLSVLFTEGLHSTTGTCGEKGIGIGLKLCRDLCAVNNCTLSLDSAPGEGTTASLTLALPPAERLQAKSTCRIDKACDTDAN